MKLAGVKNMKMLQYLAVCLGMHDAALEELSTRVIPTPDVLAAFLVSGGMYDRSIEGLSACLKVSTSTIFEILNVIKGDVKAVPRMIHEAYDDIPLTEPGAQEANKKEEIPFDVEVLDILCSLCVQDEAHPIGDSLAWVIRLLQERLTVFYPGAASKLIHTVVACKDLKSFSDKAHEYYELCTTIVPSEAWSKEQTEAWLGIQSLRGSSNTLVMYMARDDNMSEECVKMAKTLFNAVSGGVSLQELIQNVKNIPTDVVELVGEASVGSQYKAFSPQQYDWDKAVYDRMQTAIGEQDALLMESIVRVICRNSRVDPEVLKTLGSFMEFTIDDVLGFDSPTEQQKLLSCLIDVSMKRWRNGIPKLVELLLTAEERPIDEVVAVTETVRALVPPFDSHSTKEWYAIIGELILSQTDNPKLQHSMGFIKGMYTALNSNPGNGEFAGSVMRMMTLLREMSSSSNISMNSVRATTEIIQFNDCINSDIGDPVLYLSPMALRLMEFPETRVRALMRVVNVLRASDSLELFTMIAKLKLKITEGEVTQNDLYYFFDGRHDNMLTFVDFQNMLNFYEITVSFDRAVTVFCKAAGSKGYVDKQTFPILMEHISNLCISGAMDAMGLTTLNIAIGIISLGALLGAGLAFILLGIQGFSDNSDLGAMASSALPATFGKSVEPKKDLKKLKAESGAAMKDAFEAITK